MPFTDRSAQVASKAAAMKAASVPANAASRTVDSVASNTKPSLTISVCLEGFSGCLHTRGKCSDSQSMAWRGVELHFESCAPGVAQESPARKVRRVVTAGPCLGGGGVFCGGM